jgi:Secretion system C-terminal sorting domain
MKKLLLLASIASTSFVSAQSTIFAEDWDGNGPGIIEWQTYNLDGLNPVGPDGVDGEALSFLVQDAWSFLSLAEIQGANPDFADYPAGATGMAGNIVASNSWYNPVGTANDWLVSPLITVPAGTSGLNLNWAATSLGNAQFLEDYRVYVSPTGGDQVADFTSLILDVNNELNTGNYRTVALNPALAGTSFRIAFRNDGVDQYVMFLDNISITGTLSNDEFFSNKFNTYPNPAKDLVTISSSENININSVSIADINGRTVKSVELNNVSETQINVSDLTSGVYFMNIYAADGKAVKKFIKN